MSEDTQDQSRRQDGLGQPDDLERLWTPYRMAYIRGENKPSDSTADTCPFCRIGGAAPVHDEDNLVIHRGEATFVVLNLYPYTAGHLMICPYRHVSDYTELDAAETTEVAAFTKRAMTVVRAVSDAQGFNIGLNQGAAAGAGIAAHLHQHVVPRWVGDANFMPVIGHTKTLPALLHETRNLICQAWSR